MSRVRNLDKSVILITKSELIKNIPVCDVRAVYDVLTMKLLNKNSSAHDEAISCSTTADKYIKERLIN